MAPVYKTTWHHILEAHTLQAMAPVYKITWHHILEDHTSQAMAPVYITGHHILQDHNLHTFFFLFSHKYSQPTLTFLWTENYSKEKQFKSSSSSSL
jgi:hypothetical protein